MRSVFAVIAASTMALTGAGVARAQDQPPPGSYERYEESRQTYPAQMDAYRAREAAYEAEHAAYQRQLHAYERARAAYEAMYGPGTYAQTRPPAYPAPPGPPGPPERYNPD